MDRVLIRIKRFIPKTIFNLFQPLYHWGLALIGALIYGFPSRSLKVIGVTGTSGKTTTVELLYEIFSKSGFKAASISSLQFRMPAKARRGSPFRERIELNMLKMTTPGRFKVQKLLKEAKQAGAKYVFLEITSEGIKQYRHKFIKFYAAIFTNLSEEHLESHGGFENYRRAKEKLFRVAPIHILNADDPSFTFFNRIPAKREVVYKMTDYPEDLKTQLLGEFNRNNILAAITFAKEENVSWEVIKKAVEGFSGLPGRMEFVETDERFKVLVDYAFLPQALEKVYETLNDLGYKKLIAVTGACGGGRDKWKRPHLGDVAARFCEKVYVTNEDPYDEDPMSIINEVAGSYKEFIKILDRREAIREALASAKRGEGEVVVVTGKGAEPWIMGPQGSRIAWDDREIVREEIKKV